MRQLEVFCLTAQMQSMSRAAEQMFLTQPAVSRQIRALEEFLSTVLFDRHGPRVTLTPAGRILKQLAEPLVEATNHLPLDLATEMSGRVSGRIHVVAGLTAAISILPKHLKRFTTAYPNVEVRVDTTGAADGLRRIRDDNADFGVGTMEACPDDLEFHHILSSGISLIVPLDHSLIERGVASAEDLIGYPFILPISGTHTRAIIDAVARFTNANLHTVVETEDFGVIKRYVEAGVGIAAVPDLCVTGQDRVRRIPFDEHVSSYVRPRRYGAIMRRDAATSVAASRLIQTMCPDFRGRGVGRRRGVSADGLPLQVRDERSR